MGDMNLHPPQWFLPDACRLANDGQHLGGCVEFSKLINKCLRWAADRYGTSCRQRRNRREPKRAGLRNVNGDTYDQAGNEILTAAICCSDITGH